MLSHEELLKKIDKTYEEMKKLTDAYITYKNGEVKIINNIVNFSNNYESHTILFRTNKDGVKTSYLISTDEIKEIEYIGW